MSKEKIIELLQSKDLELRMIGLSYLNEDKNNPNLYLVYNTETYSYSVDKIKESPILIYRDSFDVIYNRLYDFNITYTKKFLLPYVNYCIRK